MNTTLSTTQAVVELHAAIVNVVPIKFGPYAIADRIVAVLTDDGVLDGFDLEVLVAALDTLADQVRHIVARHVAPFADADLLSIDPRNFAVKILLRILPRHSLVNRWLRNEQGFLHGE